LDVFSGMAFGAVTGGVFYRIWALKIER